MTYIMTEKPAHCKSVEQTTLKPLKQPAQHQPIAYALAAGEDRCAVRKKVSIPAHMRFSCSQSFVTEVSDISLAGFSCDALLQIHPGTRCWITLPGLGSLEGEVVRHDNRGLGCAFAVLLNPAVLDRLLDKYGVAESQAPQLDQVR